jgi:hypothetical protein
MESWSHSICLLMRCLKEGRHPCVGGARRSQVAFNWCWEGKVLNHCEWKSIIENDGDTQKMFNSSRM